MELSSITWFIFNYACVIFYWPGFFDLANCCPSLDWVLLFETCANLYFLSSNLYFLYKSHAAFGDRWYIAPCCVHLCVTCVGCVTQRASLHHLCVLRHTACILASPVRAAPCGVHPCVTCVCCAMLRASLRHLWVLPSGILTTWQRRVHTWYIHVSDIPVQC